MSMTKEQLELMASSKTAEEWDANCDKVKAAHGGYPDDWNEKVVLSKLVSITAAKWGGDADIHIV